MKKLSFILLALVLMSPIVSTQTMTCPAGGTLSITYPGGVATVVCTPGTPALQPPAVLTFVATPPTITLGQSSVLTGTAAGGPPDQVVITPGNIDVTGKPSYTVTPTVTTTYRLTATNKAGSSWRETTVTVNPVAPKPVPPTIKQWQPTVQEITLGQSVTFNYAVAGTPTPTLSTYDHVTGSAVAVLPTSSTATQMVFTPTVVGVHPYELRANNAVPPAASSMWSVTVKGGTVPNPPQPVACQGTWSDYAPTPPGTWSACSNGTQTREEFRTFNVAIPAQNGGKACEAAHGAKEVRTASRSCAVEPPPATGQVWGTTADPDVLGDFTQAEHDAWTEDGGDGWRYPTHHPQCPTAQGRDGRCFGHEHGDDPRPYINAQVQFLQGKGVAANVIAHFSRPYLFGYIGRRHPMPNEPNGHLEPNAGFKCFGANPGMFNDEGRMNLIYSISCFHMGTGGPPRFNTTPHSADIRLIVPDRLIMTSTQLMMNTGGTGIVCDPRTPGQVKDVIAIDFPARCGGKKLGSQYEIWRTQQTIKVGGREIVTLFANPAAFDPITAFNPANPTELVMIGGKTDPRVQAIKEFPTDDWSVNRGCQRESYAQPGYYRNSAGPTVYQTDADGNVTTGPNTLTQYVSAHNANIDGDFIPATTDPPGPGEANGAFKQKNDWCNGLEFGGGVTPRASAPAFTLNKNKLSLKN